MLLFFQCRHLIYKGDLWGPSKAISASINIACYVPFGYNYLLDSSLWSSLNPRFDPALQTSIKQSHKNPECLKFFVSKTFPRKKRGEWNLRREANKVVLVKYTVMTWTEQRLERLIRIGRICNNQSSFWWSMHFLIQVNNNRSLINVVDAVWPTSQMSRTLCSGVPNADQTALPRYYTTTCLYKTGKGTGC